MWLAGEVGPFSLPADSERNDEDREPLQAGIFRSRDGKTWEVPSIAPWTWQQADVEGAVRFLPIEKVKRTPPDTETWGSAWADRPRPGVREAAQGKDSEGVSCVVSDGQRVWVGTRGEGVWCLEEDRWRRLWPTSKDKAERWGHFIPRHREDTVLSMVLAGDQLWIATAAGLRRCEIPSGRIEKINNRDIGFRTRGTEPVLEKVGDRIWFSPPWSRTNTGIFFLAAGSKTWQNLIPDANATCFAGQEKTVWIGTARGLLRYDTRSGEKKLFTTRDGLAGDFVVSLATDKRFIWVGTRQGITRLDREIFESPFHEN